MHTKKNPHDPKIEALNESLNDPETLEAYKLQHDGYKPSLLPRILGTFLVFCGNTVYGHKPTYLKFRAVEVIARVPYHSWSSASYTHHTLFFTDEARAVKYANATTFADHAQENETMHVVVISKLIKDFGDDIRIGFIRHTLIPILFSFFYFWTSYILYMLNPRWSYELNYLFESHAFEQYSTFLEMYGEKLKEKSIESAYLAHYGRTHANHYEFFRAVRNDEIIHRNASIEAILKL